MAEQIIAEEWRTIFGFEGRYEISNHGRFRSVDRVIVCVGRWKKPVGRLYRGRIMRHWKQASGYQYATLAANGRKTYAGIHNLVLIAFVGQCPTGMECCHNDGSTSNNHVSNLRWDTHKANLADRIKHGTAPRGEASCRATITEKTAKKIKTIARQGVSLGAIAARFGVSKDVVSAIKHNRSWKHI